MLVETFECEETTEETPNMSEEAITLMQQLGMSQQIEKMVKKSDTGDSLRCPYRELTGEEFFIYSTLCPERTSLRIYSASPIPLRVLQVAAHAKSFFDEMQVWHVSSPAIKDPVLVGIMGNAYDTSAKRYILARWGESLDEHPAMIKQAIAMSKENLRAKLNEISIRVKNVLDSVDLFGPADLAKKSPVFFE